MASDIRARPHNEDDGWDYKSRMREAIPGIRFETWAVPFLASLSECRLYVADHLETTFVEALIADKPCLFFYNPRHFRLLSHAEPIFRGLTEAGILYHDPEAAADAVAAAYPDVEKWWADPRKQAARHAFCESFAMTSADVVGHWVEELVRLAGETG
jgi:putative transferase (TIGR04331 family)